jgi:hypothetical protein
MQLLGFGRFAAGEAIPSLLITALCFFRVRFISCSSAVALSRGIIAAEVRGLTPRFNCGASSKVGSDPAMDAITVRIRLSS